jgi:hypothetical protein
MTPGGDTSLVAHHLVWVGSAPTGATRRPRTNKERE